MKKLILIALISLSVSCAHRQVDSTEVDSDEPSVVSKIFHGIGLVLGGAGQALQHAHDNDVDLTCRSRRFGNTVYTDCQQ